MAFLGDGFVQNNNQLLIATLAYSQSNLAAFIEHLNNLMNIKASIQADHPNTRKSNKLPPRGKVYIGPEFSYKFSNQIFQYMPQSGWYKLPKDFNMLMVNTI